MRGFLYNLATDRVKGIIPSFLKFFLLLLSFIYGFLIRILSFFLLRDKKHFSVKIISVGNITLGGTGKTTLVELVSSYIKAKGFSVAIVTRGYKLQRDSSFADEPRMLGINLSGIPILVDRKRSRAIKRAMREYGADVVILDDGMQQWRIRKDLEIVTINLLNPFGNFHMLPRGILREPLLALKRADVLVLTCANFAKDILETKEILRNYNPKALLVEAVYQPLYFYGLNKEKAKVPLEFVRHRKVALLSAIGQPSSFFKTVEELNAEIILDFKFFDHHFYSIEELQLIADNLRKKEVAILITTQKDAVRLEGLDYKSIFGEIELLVLKIELKIKDEELFFNRINRALSS